jgi:predicted dehydrogenase
MVYLPGSRFDSPSPTSMPIRLGFVGLSSQGWASSTLAAPLFRPPLSSKYHIVAVSTSNPESAAQSAKKYSELGTSATGEEIKARPYYGSTEHISSDPDVDMVAVSIKTTMHKEAAMKVIEAGKDLFLEWPAGRNANETEELYRAAKMKGIRTMVGAQFRASIFAKEVRMFLIQFLFVDFTILFVLLQVKSIIQSGGIGRVLSSTLVSTFMWINTI